MSIYKGTSMIAGGAPVDVYTKTNLLGGNDIEIIPEPVEGGIDENTVACWHFDGKNTDEVNGLALTYFGPDGSTDPYNTSVMKFGTASVKDHRGTHIRGNDISALNITDTSWTLDFWFYQTNYQSSGQGYYGLGVNDYGTDFLGIGIYRHGVRLRGLMWGNGSADQTEVDTITETTWNHAAIEYDHTNKKCYLFVNGKKVYEGQATDMVGKTFNNLYISHNSGPTLLIDELRISNVLRWEEDFEVPTKAYEVPKPTGNMVVNFVGDIQTVKNDLDELGDQVSEIESKIPGTTSTTNLLVNKSELESITNTKVTGEGVTSIKVLTQADYTALETKDQNTCYIIVG